MKRKNRRNKTWGWPIWGAKNMVKFKSSALWYLLLVFIFGLFIGVFWGSNHPYEYGLNYKREATTWSYCRKNLLAIYRFAGGYYSEHRSLPDAESGRERLLKLLRWAEIDTDSGFDLCPGRYTEGHLSQAHYVLANVSLDSTDPMPLCWESYPAHYDGRFYILWTDGTVTLLKCEEVVKWDKEVLTPLGNKNGGFSQ